MDRDEVFDKSDSTSAEIETLKVKLRLYCVVSAGYSSPCASWLLSLPQDIHSGHSHIWLPG